MNVNILGIQLRLKNHNGDFIENCSNEFDQN
jgi:hypothetical protein